MMATMPKLSAPERRTLRRPKGHAKPSGIFLIDNLEKGHLHWHL
jgi:hypothetical protein